MSRPRLCDLLDLALERRLTVVVAPAGAGKTTLLRQWDDAHPTERVQWLTLTADHDDPARLARDLFAALVRSGGATEAALLVSAGGRRLGPAYLDRLLTAVRAAPSTTLVLDGFEHLANGELVDDLAELLELAPPSLHVILAGRHDLPLRFYRLRLVDALGELRKEDLAFTADEARDLVERRSGRLLGDDEVAALLARTDGWAHGVALAATGDDAGGAAYLTAEVVDRQPRALLRFLVGTSVLDRMSGPLCDHVLHHPRSQAVLEELERTSTFTSSLDRSQDWFRYQPQLREVLRQRLRQDCPDSEPILLRRAAEWHLGRGDVEAGVGYLLEAGAWDEVVHVALQHGHSRVTEVAAWLARVPPSVRESRADVLLLEAAALVLSDDTARVPALLDAVAARDGTVETRLAVTLLRSLGQLLEGESASALRTIEPVLHQLDLVDEAKLPTLFGLLRHPADVVAAASVVRGLALLYEGRSSEARVVLDGVHDEAHAAWRVWALGGRALLDAWDGNLTSAEQVARQALLMGARAAVDAPMLVCARLALSLVFGERDALARAAGMLDQMVVHAGGHPGPRVVAWVDTERARLALAADQPAAALALLAADAPADDGAGRRVVVLPPAVRARRRAAEVEALLVLGEVERARQLLDAAADRDAPEVRASRIHLAVELGDLAEARALLEGWPEDDRLRIRLERRLWRAALDHLEGDEAGAAAAIEAVVREAEPEGFVGVFRPVGRLALGPARALYRAQPSAFLRTVVDRPLAAGPVKRVKGLVEQVTAHEHLVLVLLPTRLSNAEIADQLGVSLNTIKTHLKHLYRKLDVAGRSDAVVAAERLHLL